MSVERTRATVRRYIESQHTDPGVLADDVVFTTMATGAEHHGREGVRRMLHYLYREAFDAHAELRTLVCEERHAVAESLFVGRHTGEFAGVAATNREVRVPLCIVFELVDARIRRARVYLEVMLLMQQIGAMRGGPLPVA